MLARIVWLVLCDGFMGHSDAFIQVRAPMHARAHQLLGALSVVGSALGLVALVVPLLQGRGEMWLLFLTAFHVCGIWSGLAAWRRQDNWARWQALFWLVQMPLVLSPSFSYLLSAGAGGWLYTGSQLILGWSFYFGSQFKVGAGQAGEGFVVGLNTIAGALVVLSMACGRRAALTSRSSGPPSAAAELQR
jgi:hypothetical protein